MLLLQANATATQFPEPTVSVAFAAMGILAVVFIFFFRVVRSVDKDVSDLKSEHGERIKAVETSLEGAKEQLKVFIDLYRDATKGKPDNPGPRKRILLEKLKSNTITMIEARELKAVLEKEKKRASAGGDLVEAIAIIGILILIAIVIGELTKGK